MKKFFNQNFKKTNIRISLEDKRLEYSVDIQEDKKLGLINSGIYLIVAQDSKNNDHILYVGKAGKGLNKRFNEHKAGYERKIKNDKKWVSNLQERMEEIKVKTVSVWFRESKVLNLAEIFDINLPDGASYFSSQYSLEEEALINYLKNNERLINSSIPPEARNPEIHKIELNTNKKTSLKKIPVMNEGSLNQLKECFYNLLFQQMKDTSKSASLVAGTSAISSWSDDTKNNFYAVICKLKRNKYTSKLLNNRIPGLRKYTSGPFRNTIAIVYGEFLNRNFREHTNQLHFSLDGKYLAIHPFDPQKIIVSTLDDYLN